MIELFANPYNYDIAVRDDGKPFRLYRNQLPPNDANYTVIRPGFDKDVRVKVKAGYFQPVLLSNLSDVFFDSNGMLNPQFGVLDRLRK